MTITGMELARIDDAMLELVEPLVDPADTVKDATPILRLNYVAREEGSEYDKGTWVVGQAKDKDGNIVEQGFPTETLVILSVRNRFSYYDASDTDRNCSSPYHKSGDWVTGNKYKNFCSANCPYRAKDIVPRCKAQKVLFGVAYTPDGAGYECMAFMSGANYVPFTDYYRKLTKSRGGEKGTRNVPPFMRPTILGSRKEKFSTTTYYVGTYEMGPIFEPEQIQAFAERRDFVKQVIDQLNVPYGVREEPKDVSSHTPQLAAVGADADLPF